MARNAKYYNSDNSPVLACTHGRYSHAFKSEWFQHPPCTAEQAEWLIHSYRRRGFEVKKALSLDYIRFVGVVMETGLVVYRPRWHDVMSRSWYQT